MTDPHLSMKKINEDPSWALERITELPDVRHGLISSYDGMVTGKSKELGVPEAEGIAAMSSAVLSASRAATNEALGVAATTPLMTVTTVSKHGVLIIMPAGVNSFLVAVCEPEPAMGPVMHAMATQARKLGQSVMSVAARASSGPPS